MKRKAMVLISAVAVMIMCMIVFAGCDVKVAGKTFEEHRLLLKESGEFEGTASAEMIEDYAYVDYSFDSEVQKQIREKYDVVEIAGTGNTLDKTINILAWISDNIIHDGRASLSSGVMENSITLMDYAFGNTDDGINCYFLAIVLNDCLKSVGIKSKMCYLMPKDGDTRDNHVGNMVYIDNLDKWILVDPSWNAFFQDENDVYLDVFELRDAFANNKPVTVNEEAHHNHKEYDSDADEGYKTYMAKNLYYFRTNNNADSTITFIPKDFDLKTWNMEFYQQRLDDGSITQEQFDKYEESSDIYVKYTFSKEVFLMVD